MSEQEFHGLLQMYASLTGLNSAVGVVASIAVGSALMRLLPWERGRPVRAGFVLLAPIIVTISLAAAFFGGLGAFYFIMFGLFEDRIGMPWLTFLPAMVIGPTFGLALGLGLAFILGRLLRHV